MVFGDVDPGRLVCHYTQAWTFFDYIEPTMRLRAGPMATVNDPREARDWTISLVADIEGEVNDADFWALQREFNEIARQRTLLLCCTADPGIADSELVGDRGFAHPGMWAHYGESHRGVCLLLDRQALDDTFSELVDDLGATNISGPVIYGYMGAAEQVDAFTMHASRLQAVGLVEAVRQHLQDFGGVLYRKKHPDWAHEDEIRWILFDPQRATMTEAMLPIENALLGVVVGDQFEGTPAWNRTLQGLARDGVPLAQIRWRNGAGFPLPLVT